MNSLASDNPKSFQIWHQRQALADRASTPENEMEFINHMIENDSKNYHAWSYRQWIVSHYNMWEFERVDLHRIIMDDVWNNSAWNQRFYVVSRGDCVVTDEIIGNEIQYAIGKIHMAPRNECPWNYIQGYKKLSLDF